MANVFKTIKISEEVTYIGNTVIPTHPVIPPIPEKAEIPFDDDPINEDDNVNILSEALAQEHALLKKQTNTLNTLLHSIPQAISDNRQQLSSDIADIVLLIVSKFFIHQQQSKDAITHQITQIVTQLNEKQNLEISLHPHDLALIQQGDMTIDLLSCKNLRLKSDDQLRLGGCIITSEHGVFDASIERQIDNLKQVLLKMRDGS